MKRKIIISLILVLSLIFSSNFSAKAAEGTSIPSTESGTTLVPLSDELQTKENIANDKYNTLLKSWAYDPNFISDINANFPLFYGGAYINENKELVIQVTTLNDEIRTYFSNLIDLTDTRFEVVKYSFEKLKAEKENIVNKMKSNTNDEIISDISGVSISLRKNSVSVHLSTNKSKHSSVNPDKDVKSKISSFENLEVILTDEEDEQCASVQPGTGIYNNGYYRSIGFWAISNNGDVGIVTAPHATISQGEIISVNGQVFGVAQTPYYGGNLDAVFIKRTNSSFTESRSIPGWGFNLSPQGYVYLGEGATVYSYGITTQAQMGTVKSISYTSRTGISDVVLTTIHALEGDSGGIVAYSTTRYTAGIKIGKSVDGEMYYVKAGNIINGMGLSVY